MIVSQLDHLDLVEAWSKGTPADRMRFGFAVHAGTGAEACAAVYFVLEPGGAVPTHTDSAEEIVLVLEGTVEGRVGDERSTLQAGGMVLIPAMAPHGLRNTGTGIARGIGFFAGANVVSRFEDRVMPVDRTVLGTPPVVEQIA